MIQNSFFKLNFFFYNLAFDIGPDFAFSWSGKPGKKFQSRKDQVRQKLSSLANSIYCKFFKDADLTPHGAMATLIQISKTINSCVNPTEVNSLHKNSLMNIQYTKVKKTLRFKKNDFHENQHTFTGVFK